MKIRIYFFGTFLLTLVIVIDHDLIAQTISDLPGVGKSATGLSADPKPAGKKGQVGEFVIKGEGGLILDSEKPPLDTGPNEFSPLIDTFKTEGPVFYANPPDFNRMKESAPTLLRSDYVVVPRYFNFRPDAIAHEYNLKSELDRVYQEKDSKEAERRARWEFRVADAAGKIFMQFSGKGLPPERLAIPTRNSSSDAIRPGNPYGGVLTYRDIHGDVHTMVTGTFVLSGLVERTSKGYILHLAMPILFNDSSFSNRDGKFWKLNESAEALLQETADWIKSHRAVLAPLYIHVFARDEARGKDQAQFLAEKLANYLLRNLDNIQARSVLPDGNLEEHVEIAVFLPKDQKDR